VGDDAHVPEPPGVPSHRFPDCVLMPGLVNAHTHLELTGFERTVPTSLPFPEWIRALRAAKAERTPADFLTAARQGVRDCFRAGITTVADTGDSGTVIEALAEVGGSGVCYVETFGPHPSQKVESLSRLELELGARARFQGPRLRLGVSPHAPYTVSGPLYEGAVATAQARGLPLAVHVAESPAESRFLREAAGPFAEYWMQRGIPLPPAPPGQSPVEWLDRHGVLGPQTLCIHAVQVSPTDIARLALAGVAIAHCPRSNRAHGHGDAPLAALLAAGLRVAVGTDSVASTGDLDLLADAQLAQRLGGLSAERALALVTLDAARALGLADEVGHLGRDCWGDACLVATGPTDDPATAVLAAGCRAVVATYLGGREAYRAAPETPA
jgi:5-methylthioadenosine/S-adenosylhomocysteine deaminase